MAEDKSEGTVGLGTYCNYLKLSGSWILNIFVLLFTIVPSGLRGYLSLFISDWVAMEPDEQPGQAWMYIALTGGLVLAQTLSWIALMGLLLTLS